MLQLTLELTITTDKQVVPVTKNEKSWTPILRQCISVVPAGVMLWPQNTRHATLTCRLACRRFIVKHRAFSRSRPREANLPPSLEMQEQLISSTSSSEDEGDVHQFTINEHNIYRAVKWAFLLPIS